VCVCVCVYARARVCVRERGEVKGKRRVHLLELSWKLEAMGEVGEAPSV